MRRAARWLLGAGSLAVACSGTVNEARPTGGAGGAGGGGGSGSGGSAGTGAEPPALTPVGSIGALSQACTAPAVGRPVLRLLNRKELENTLADIFPEIAGKFTVSLPADSVSPFGFDNDESAVVGPQAAAAILDTATSVATAVAGDALQNLLPCSTSAQDRACAEQFLSKYGRRLFRRALSPAERDRYLGFFDATKAKADFKSAIKWMTVGLIQSPNAIYRREIGAVAADGSRQLSSQELATELAYTYSGTTPSSDLLDKGDAGSLGDAAALARSLLGTPRGKDVLRHFFSSWLGYDRVTSVEKPNVQPFAQVRGDMAQETLAFVDNTIVAQGGGLAELLTSRTTYPSRALAGFYGFPPPGTDYAATERPASRGLGILAQGSFLATRAQPNGSSPTQRGVFVFERLLCQDKPAVPPNIPSISAPQTGKVTTRERYEKQHAQGYCLNCHKEFDPIGFGFEHFDEGGRYRQDEGGLPIDSSSNVPGETAPLFSFADQEGLVQGLAKLPQASQCFTGYLATYAFGMGTACLGPSRLADFAAGKVGIVDYFASLAAEPHFSRRAAP